MESLKKAQRRSSLYTKDFIECVFEEAVSTFPPLAKKNYTLPKLLAHFQKHSSEEYLHVTIAAVIKKYSRTH
jgi:hypothetical protein